MFLTGCKLESPGELLKWLQMPHSTHWDLNFIDLGWSQRISTVLNAPGWFLSAAKVENQWFKERKITRSIREWTACSRDFESCPDIQINGTIIHKRQRNYCYLCSQCWQTKWAKDIKDWSWGSVEAAIGSGLKLVVSKTNDRSPMQGWPLVSLTLELLCSALSMPFSIPETSSHLLLWTGCIFWSQPKPQCSNGTPGGSSRSLPLLVAWTLYVSLNLGLRNYNMICIH